MLAVFLSWGEGAERGGNRAQRITMDISCERKHFLPKSNDRHNPSVKSVIIMKKVKENEIQVPITGNFMVNINILEDKTSC